MAKKDIVREVMLITKKKLELEEISNEIVENNRKHCRHLLDLASHARTISDAGAEVTSMEHFKKPLRNLAIIFGKLIVFSLKFITEKQIKFNNLLLNIVSQLAEHQLNCNDMLIKKQFETDISVEAVVGEVYELKLKIEELDNRLRSIYDCTNIKK